MLKKLLGKRKKEGDKVFNIILVGIALIILVSFVEGFGPAFTHMIDHLQGDLKEWEIHLYILGWLLVLYGFYRLREK